MSIRKFWTNARQYWDALHASDFSFRLTPITMLTRSHGHILAWGNSWPRPPRAGLGPNVENFLGPTARVDPLKFFILNQKDWLSAAVIWAWYEMVSWYNRRIMILSRKTKTWYIEVVRPPSRPPGTGKWHRLPLPLVSNEAGNDMCFRQRAGVGFLVKEKIRLSDMHSWSQHAKRNACSGASSVRWW
jgi:hypothetical protein